jgi:hypothetical protein
MSMKSVFLTLIIGMAACPQLAFAEIDFAHMPVGCSWTTRYSDGQVLTETFVGKKSGTYHTKVTKSGEPQNLVRQSYYDKKGRLVRKVWANGKWEKFAPFSCFDSVGSCTYKYSNADGVSQQIHSETTRKGKVFVVAAGPEDGKPYPDEYFELGAFGLMAKNSASNYSAKLIKLEGCDSTGS